MLVVAALWGFAEATLFFIVPDVWICFVAARRGWRAGLLASAAACAGALLGGVIMYQWGKIDPEATRHFLDMIPAISPSMIWLAGYELRDQGLVSMLAGAFTDVPFKIYAVEAGAAGMGLITFLAMAIVARFARFVLTTLIAAAAAQVMRRFLSEPTIFAALSAFWIVFYGWYFTVTG